MGKTLPLVAGYPHVHFIGICVKRGYRKGIWSCLRGLAHSLYTQVLCHVTPLYFFNLFAPVDNDRGKSSDDEYIHFTLLWSSVLR